MRRKNCRKGENGGYIFKNLLPHINSLPKDKILDLSKLKGFADNKINETKKLEFVLGWVENIVVKGENAGYQHFLLFT